MTTQLGDPTFAVRLVYKRSMRRPLMACGVPSREVADIFVRALEADDRENARRGETTPWTYEVEMEEDR